MKKKEAQCFEESGIEFCFEAAWIVRKFDQDRFYKGLSGAGFKGVDFIGILEGKSLVLLEVKNYNNVYLRDGIHPTEEFLKNRKDYLNRLKPKLWDSLKLIKIVHKYYLRKWWYRKILLPLYQSFPSVFWKTDWGFWTKAYFLQKNSLENIHFVLWLEFDESIDTEEVLSESSNFLQETMKGFLGKCYVLNSKNAQNVLRFSGIKKK